VTFDVPEPVFDRPPVAEVTLSVQFAPLLDMTAVHIGKLWETWAEEYPNTEEHDELAPLPDEASASRLAPSFHIAIRDRPLPRTWFLDSAGEHVIQVQRDRLVLNWRRREDGYPHYSLLLPRFRSVYEQFVSFADELEIGAVTPNQCHVTYLNPIPLSGDGACPDGLPGLLEGWSAGYSTLPSLEGDEATIQLRYPIEMDADVRVGSLHVSAGSAINATTAEPVLLLEMTARGKPLASSLDGVVDFFDLGHYAIVTMFAALTTSEMHNVWGKHP